MPPPQAASPRHHVATSDRPLYAFFVLEIASRRVVHVGVTPHPTDAWVARQLRKATPFGRHVKQFIIDHDSKYGEIFARIAQAPGLTSFAPQSRTI